MRVPALVFALCLGSSAWAADTGLPVAVKVLDTAGAPIPTAVVRHPDEKERHRVNIENGTWTGEAVYLEDGTELLFAKNMELVFEVSAPGYKNVRVPYIVQKRKNVVEVVLEKLDIELDPEEDGAEGPAIQFKHDVPRE